MPNISKYLRRYTHCEALRDILCTKSITLLNCEKWSDKNDSYFLQLYQRERKLKSLLALCLTQSPERDHLWHVFAPKDELTSLKNARRPLGCQPYNSASPLTKIGVRIRFDRALLAEAVLKHRGIKCEEVEYLTQAQLEALAKKQKNIDPIARLPFIKRFGFRDELEFRIIYGSKTRSLATMRIPIPLSCINRVILSYKLKYDDYRALRSQLRLIDGCSRLDIRRSNLIDSKTWKATGDRVVEIAKQ